MEETRSSAGLLAIMLPGHVGKNQPEYYRVFRPEINISIHL
jgi:hypothetical protein